jgi:hypothetical protein
MKQSGILRTLSRLGGPQVSLLADDGKVRCPNYGDIEVDVCMQCPRLTGFSGSGVVCRDDRSWWSSDTYLST